MACCKRPGGLVRIAPPASATSWSHMHVKSGVGEGAVFEKPLLWTAVWRAARAQRRWQAVLACGDAGNGRGLAVGWPSSGHGQGHDQRGCAACKGTAMRAAQSAGADMHVFMLSVDDG